MPLLSRRAGIEKANLAAHELPNGGEPLLSINTNAKVVDFFLAFNLHDVFLNVEDNGRNKVTHCKIMLSKAKMLMQSSLLRIELIKVAARPSSQTTSLW